MDVRTTLLAAHALPPEYAGRADAYIDHVIHHTLPAAAAAGVDAVDAFCETIAFSVPQTRKLFARAAALGLRVKLHADQLSDSGGAILAANCNALSADHLDRRARRVCGTGAKVRYAWRSCLPVRLRLARDAAPADRRAPRHGVAMAVATDCNPGTSPTASLLLMLSMACTLFRLTPQEALAGVTRNAAKALGLSDRGVLAVGMRADLAAYDVAIPAELCYRIGGNAGTDVVRGGRVIKSGAAAATAHAY